MNNKHTAKKIDDGEYEYRGYTIYRDDNVSNGYFGRWKTGSRVPCSGDTLASVKKNIDNWIESKKAA